MSREIEIAKQVIATEITALKALGATFNEDFTALIERITKVQKRVVWTGVGKSGYIANKIATTMSSTGTPAIFVHPAEAAHGDLGMMTKGDMVIMLSNSGNTLELYPIAQYAKHQDIDILLITRNTNSKLGKEVKTIVLPNTEEACDLNVPTTSALMMLAYGDAICIALYKNKGFSRENYKLLHPAGNIGDSLKTLEEIMHKRQKMPCVESEASFTSAILEMSIKRFGCVGVISDGYLVGMITDGDLRRHITDDITKLKAKDVMTSDPHTFSAKVFIPAALQHMRELKITNSFVVDEHNKPIGIIHIHDLLPNLNDE